MDPRQIWGRVLTLVESKKWEFHELTNLLLLATSEAALAIGDARDIHVDIALHTLFVQSEAAQESRYRLLKLSKRLSLKVLSIWPETCLKQAESPAGVPGRYCRAMAGAG